MEDADPLLGEVENRWKGFRSAWSQAAKALDIKRTHDLRVEARRLSASLTLLRSVVDDDRIERVRHQLKKLQKRLGPLRDVQVQLAEIQRRTSVSLGVFRESLQRIEKRETRKVAKYLSADRRNNYRRKLRVIRRNAERVLQSASDIVVANKVRSALRSGFEDLATARAKLSLFDDASHHAVRGAARQLRYLLEGAESVVGPAPREQLEMLHGFQTRLGKIRDQQLLEDEIRRMSKSLGRGPDRRDMDKACRDLARSRTRQLKAFFDSLQLLL